MNIKKKKKRMKNTKENKKSLTNRILSLIGHFFSVILITISSWPIIVWYYEKKPALGVDYYLMASYVGYFQRYLAFPWNGWKYIWYAGVPLFNDYPPLHFYLAVPFADIFGVFRGVQIYLLFTNVLFLILCYFLFWLIARNKVFALILSVAIGFSAIIYGSLFFGGNSSFQASLFMLPLVLIFIIKFYHTSKKLYLLWAGLFAGLSFYAHTGFAVFFLMPVSMLMLFFYSNDKIKIFSWQKIKNALNYFILTLLTGGAVIYHYLIYYTQTSGLATYGKYESWVQRFSFMSDLSVKKLVEIDNLLLYGTPVLLILFIVLALIKGKKKLLKYILAPILSFAYLVVFIYAPQRWGGVWRMYWAFPLVIALLASFSWKGIKKTIKINFLEKKIIIVIVSLVLLSGSAVYFYMNQDNFFYHFDRTDLVDMYGGKALNARQVGSYPGLTRFPDAEEKIREDIFPDWLEADRKDYRLYALDPTYNIWVNTYFDIPLVKGYVPSITTKLENWLYWIDTSLTKNDIIELHDVPSKVAENYALFNIDWMAIKYLEATDPADYDDRDNLAVRQFNGPLSTYLKKNNYIKRDQWQQDCHYYEVKDKLTSSLAKTTNVPSILTVADDEGYDLILKNIAMLNLNSQYVVPVHVTNIDDLSLEELNKFEAVFLYNYNYKSEGQAFKNLEKYVADGGNLFVETGSNSPQGNSYNLPDFFPIDSTKKESLSENWQFTDNKNSLVEDVNFKNFPGESLTNKKWGVSHSYPESLRDWSSEIIFLNDYPIIVGGDYKKGKVIWSGLNLPYHIMTNYSQEENMIFKNIIDYFVDLEQEKALLFKFERPRSEKVTIQGKKAKAVLFKESNYNGWKAKVVQGQNSQRLKIYSAGTDFMYVKIPMEYQNDFTVEFTYQGTWLTWGFYIVSFITLVYIFDYSFFRKRIFGLITFRKRKKKTLKKFSSWWDDDQA